MATSLPHLAWRSALPPWPDAAVAAAAVTAGQLVVWARMGSEPFYGSRPYNATLSLFLLGALAWWRRAPTGVVIWYVVLFCGLQAFVPHDLPVWTGFFPLVVLVAAVGRSAPLRPALIGLAVALAGFAVLGFVEPTLHRADTLVFDALVLGLPWAASRLFAVRSARADALEADLTVLAATQAEREQAAVVRERARMARELHDVVAHSVSLMVVQVGAARMALGDGADGSTAAARGQLLAAEHTGRSALDQLRRLLGVLRDPDPQDELRYEQPVGAPWTEPLPHLRDVHNLVDDFNEKGVKVRLVVDDGIDEVDPGLGLTAYRVVHEGLTNALKHSPGADVMVRVAVDSDWVRVEVTDQGGRPCAGPGTGFGLLGLRERVALYGGRLQAGPTEMGWHLQVALPRRPREQAADRLIVPPVLTDEVAG
jgi:signal transduction histidine kinase